MTRLLHRIALPLFTLAALSMPGTSGDLSVSGIPNFHQVDEHVYRGGQPDSSAWPNLAKLGVTLVIDLRREDEHSSAAEAQAVRAAGMNYVNVPMKGVVAPGNEAVNKILGLMNSQEHVFIHCKRGADRTGAMVACYRIEHEHWDRGRALAEAKSLGMSWDQFGLKRYVSDFQPVPDRIAVDVQPGQSSQ
jgi:protein tyrosine phosphatase (PTP) superfamily phosphohydrolase (DUF442 family)